MAATGPPPASPAPPTTYRDHYATQPDVLNGNYEALYAIHHLTTGQPSNTIFDTIVNSTDTIPKVFLALISTPYGTFNILPIHNPWCFKPSMVATATQWDSQVFAFVSDTSPTSCFISTISLPNDIFDAVAEQPVHPTNYINAAFAAAAPMLHLLNPIADGTPSTNLVVTRALIPVPHRYVQLALSRLPLQPRAAWSLFANAVISDSLKLPCALFLDWLCVAVTKRYNTDSTTIMAPANHLGLRDTAFPPIVDDQPFANCRWSIITRNLPALDTSTSMTTVLTTTHYTQLLGTLQSERAADRAADNARCMAEKQDKLPSETKWRYAAASWMQFTGCPTELDLPPIYHRLANCDNKCDHLLILQEAIADCARNHGAATSQVPVVSKETKELVMSGNFGVPVHEHNNLSLGIQPFAVSLYLGDELGKTVHTCADNYNLMLAGQANPTIEEQVAFSTKEVRIPQDPITAGLMLATTSIHIDVLMGVHHPFAIAFRSFCRDQWPQIQATLHLASQYTLGSTNNLIPGIMRWVQLKMVTYMEAIMSGDTSRDTPDFRELVTILHRKQYSLLPPLPDCYHIWTRPAPDRSPTLNAPVLSSPSPVSTVAPPSGAPFDAPLRKTSTPTVPLSWGALVNNTAQKSKWIVALEKSSKRIKDIHQHAPPSTSNDSDGKPLPICLSFTSAEHVIATANAQSLIAPSALPKPPP